MRRRLLQVLLPLIALLVLGSGVPAATTIAERHTATLVADRISDAGRLSIATFAALSDGAGSAGDTLVRLQAELDDYADLYDTPIWLVDRDRVVLHATSIRALPGEADERLQSVLAGQTPDVARTVWPWQRGGEIIVAPVGRDSQVVGALVFEVPITKLRRDTLVDWGVLGLALLVPLGAVLALVGPTTRWLMRPVRDLESAASAVTAGDLSSRTAVDAGPPELRTLSRSFNQMVDAVHTTVERQQAFVSDAAHQLRNPVTSVRLAVENLQPHLDPHDAEAHEVFAEAMDDLDRMRGVIEGMLAATRFQSRPAREARVADAVGSAPEAWTARCGDAGIACEVAIADDATRIMEPTGGLAACVDELVANAVRLSGARTVRVSGRRDGDVYRLEVADDGRGLTDDELVSATRRFWRSPRTQNIDGTGLGLTIVAQVCEDAGGRLELSSPAGGGVVAGLVLAVV